MGGQGCADLRCHGQIWAAIEGSFEWTGPRLTALAASRGPAAALIEAYQSQGRSCLELLSGHFSLCVFDDRDHTMLLAADGFGSRPIVFGRVGPRLIVFGSSTAGVRMHPAIRVAIDQQAVADALGQRPRPNNRTMFQGLERLGPGQALTFRPGVGIEVFSFGGSRENNLRTNRLSDDFRDRLGDAVTHCSNRGGGGTVGVLLDGALEGAVIAAALRNEWIDKSASFRASFDPIGPNRLPRPWARRAGTPDVGVRRMISDHDINSSIDRLAGAFDEPQDGLAMVPTYLGAELARERGVTLLLSGQGGARIFGGPRNAPPPFRPAGVLRMVLARGVAPYRERHIDVGTVTRAMELAGVRAEFPFLEDSMTALPALDAGAGLVARWQVHRHLQRVMGDRLRDATAPEAETDPWQRLSPMFRNNTRLRTQLCDSLTSLLDHGIGETATIVALRDEAAGPGLADSNARLAWRLLMFESWYRFHTEAVRQPDYQAVPYQIAGTVPARAMTA